MPVPISKEQQEDYLMSKSVMDAPRSVPQRMYDFFVGRTYPEKFTNMMTSLNPGIVLRGKMTREGIRAIKQQAKRHGEITYPGQPYTWIYGDVTDLPKFNPSPEAYTGIVSPRENVAGFAFPSDPKLFAGDWLTMLHDDLIKQVYEAQQKELMSRNLVHPAGEFGLKRIPTDSYSHVRLIPREGANPKFHMSGPLPEELVALAKQNPIKGAEIENRLQDQVVKLLESLNAIPEAHEPAIEKFYIGY